MTENEVQRRVKAVFRAYQGEVYDHSQGYRPGGRRHGTTRQTKGIADLLIFFPRWRTHIYFEVKKRKDEWPVIEVPEEQLPAAEREEFYRNLQTTDQRTFEACCIACGVPYGLGGVEEARAICEDLRRVNHDPKT